MKALNSDIGANALERAKSPESLGIDSRAVLGFIDDCETNHIEIHSFMLLRHGRVAAEAWWNPYAPEIPHTMFSFSKSVAGTAIGFAVDEGLVSLDTKIYDLFPEFAPAIKRKWSDELTLEHLLTMRSGKTNGFMLNTEKPGWEKSYLGTRFKFKPGEKFEYNSENSFMLAAVIKKLTGQGLLKYLQPRLFEPLGIRKPYWQKNASGLEAGGWGLYLTAEDQARFVQCYLDGGRWQGRQVIPAAWAAAAVEKHGDSTGLYEDNTAGYGYQFWRNSIGNSYRCDGLFSQFGIVFQAHDACLVTAAGEPSEHSLLEAVWRHFPSGFSEKKLPENPAALDALRARIAGLRMPALPVLPRCAQTEKEIDGKLIRFKSSKLSSVLGMADNFIAPRRSGGLNNIRLSFGQESVEFFWTETYSENTIEAGFNGQYILSEGEVAGMKYHFASCAAWMEDGSLEIWIKPLEHAQFRKLNFTFKGRNVILKSTAEKGLYDLAMYGLNFKGIKPDDLLRRVTGGVASAVDFLVEPNLFGIIIDR